MRADDFVVRNSINTNRSIISVTKLGSASDRLVHSDTLQLLASQKLRVILLVLTVDYSLMVLNCCMLENSIATARLDRVTVSKSRMNQLANERD